ncbi:MAG: 3-oxoacyl-[acyl-carrier-protein] reductase [Pseudomonadales bacterium]|jgi:3-oxoacyl-[acyl-carrier protein] reductase|nr:3-oxoacyl-[acyl-carrier-protein] reductase [Gammaproteobacteria bacterium]MDG1925528.1 3-oxoacyl-[acyl-carrier-protein] reductase [Pseudomonadales bacterium]
MNPAAVVTGASRGIGLAIAEALAKAGYYVLGTATTQVGADQFTEQMMGQGQGYVLNLSDQPSIDAFAAALKADHGAPLILVNNAGITQDNLAMRMKPAEWNAVINTNLNGVFHLTQTFMRGMMKAKFGRIINISSVVGRMGNPGQVNYAAAKAGLEGFTRALGAELASRNITVNAIAPGFIATDMTDALSLDQQTKMLERIPAARLGQPKEVAALVQFLSSDVAGYITGETIAINGGLYMS